MKYHFKIPFFILLTSFILSACHRNAVQKIDIAGRTLPPVKVLYITSVGWFHDYQSQTQLLSNGVNQYLPTQFDVIVGDVERLKNTAFWQGYDVLIYNFCHAANNDKELIKQLIKPVVELGKPVFAMHCSMHSFQYEPKWPEFLGLSTLRHEHQRRFNLHSNAHVLTKGIDTLWDLALDELYINISTNPNAEVLMTAYGIETEKTHVQSWLYQSGKGQIVGTTLGHNESTLKDKNFLRFLANGIAYLTGRDIASKQTLRVTNDISVLTADVNYPTENEKRCVIHNMFSIGGAAVNQCLTSQCGNTEKDSAKEKICHQQCALDNPWPVPETLRENCQSGKLTAPKL